MKPKVAPHIVSVALVMSLASVVGSPANGFTQAQPSNKSPQGNAKSKAAPALVYRRLNPEKDGLNFKVSDISFWFYNGGSSMDMVIGGITFTNARGQEMQIELASQKVRGGMVSTVKFGTMRIKVPDASTPEMLLFLTNEQIREIKKKLDSETSTSLHFEPLEGVINRISGDDRARQSNRVDLLIDNLKHGYPSAASALGETNDPRAVEPLVDALKATDWVLRSAAAEALGEIKDSRAVAPLISALSDADSDVRWHAAVALARIKDNRAVEPLISALKDPDSNVRRNAASALGEIKDRRAIAPLSVAQKDTEVTVAFDAGTALAKVEAANPPAARTSPTAKRGTQAQDPARKAATNLPDVLQGQLLLTEQSTMDGLGAQLLWIKAGNEKYEIVLAKSTVVPQDWRREGDKYSVALSGIQLFVLPEGLTHKQDGTYQVTLGSAITDKQGRILMAYPLVGRYAVRGKLDPSSEKIEANEIKYLSSTP